MGAMQARIDSGEAFQAKDIVIVGAMTTPEECSGVRRRKVWGRTHTFINGEPLVRIADKLLQRNRKAGRIKFKAGWWHGAPPSDPVAADAGVA